MSSRIFLSVPCSTVTISHCHSQDATMPATYRPAIRLMDRSSGAQSEFDSPTIGRMYVSMSDWRNSAEPACAAAPTKMHTTMAMTRHLYWKM